MSEALSQAIYAIDNAVGFLASWCPHGMDSARAADYGSANRARDLLTQARDELVGARMEAPIPDRLFARAPNLPPCPAGADEPEADPPERVAADPSIVDAESDPSYRHGVQDDSDGRARKAACQYCAPLSDDEWLSICDCFAADVPAAAEDERRAWLRRVQAQPIR